MDFDRRIASDIDYLVSDTRNVNVSIDLRMDVAATWLPTYEHFLSGTQDAEDRRRYRGDFHHDEST